MPQPPKTVALALTGASGMPYALRLLECLIRANVRVWLLHSAAADVVLKQECGLTLPVRANDAQHMLPENCIPAAGQLQIFGRDDWFAPPASGTNPPDAMVICPASMGVVAAVAHGTSDHLIERAADVCLKEKRPLIIVPREMPLSALHLENLLKLARLGVTIMPPAAGFYHHPEKISDLVDFVVARILDALHIENNLIDRWGS